MRKSDKKTENTLRIALTEVCDIALENAPGFIWLSHLANYDNFPRSLDIICVFNTNEELSSARQNKLDDNLCQLIQQKLQAVDIHLPNIKQQVRFDTEENCQREHEGKWHERFR